MPVDLAFEGVAGQAELVRSGEVSARELVETSLDRIGRLDPELNAFGAVYAERALAEADEADQRRARGETAPLLGVPIAVKDEMAIGGEITSRGTGAITVQGAATPRSSSGSAPPERSSSARRRCPRSGSGRSPSRSPGA